ncbi:MAG: antibiotic biosynthesis monooxygenase [Deltaproteobacteria bacterium]|nr:MAG: antibiotic biosynthesis monooxygenase [Deltaproteobacteria bacterium]
MIRVIIERKVASAMELAFHQATKRARIGAIAMDGYLGGETLRDVENHHHYIIISTWKSLGHWHQWLDSEERQQLDMELLPCLEEPESFTVTELV